MKLFESERQNPGMIGPLACSWSRSKRKYPLSIALVKTLLHFVLYIPSLLNLVPVSRSVAKMTNEAGGSWVEAPTKILLYWTCQEQALESISLPKCLAVELIYTLFFYLAPTIVPGQVEPFYGSRNVRNPYFDFQLDIFRSEICACAWICASIIFDTELTRTSYRDLSMTASSQRYEL